MTVKSSYFPILSTRQISMFTRDLFLLGIIFASIPPLWSINLIFKFFILISQCNSTFARPHRRKMKTKGSNRWCGSTQNAMQPSIKVGFSVFSNFRGQFTPGERAQRRRKGGVRCAILYDNKISSKSAYTKINKFLSARRSSRNRRKTFQKPHRLNIVFIGKRLVHEIHGLFFSLSNLNPSCSTFIFILLAVVFLSGLHLRNNIVLSIALPTSSYTKWKIELPLRNTTIDLQLYVYPGSKVRGGGSLNSRASAKWTVIIRKWCEEARFAVRKCILSFAFAFELNLYGMRKNVFVRNEYFYSYLWKCSIFFFQVYRCLVAWMRCDTCTNSRMVRKPQLLIKHSLPLKFWSHTILPPNVPARKE